MIKRKPFSSNTLYTSNCFFFVYYQYSLCPLKGVKTLLNIATGSLLICYKISFFILSFYFWFRLKTSNTCIEWKIKKDEIFLFRNYFWMRSRWNSICFWYLMPIENKYPYGKEVYTKHWSILFFSLLIRYDFSLAKL